MSKILRILGYVRVSQRNRREGDRFISPSEQRKTIKQFVDGRGHELVDVLTDIDESGSTFARPMFEQVMERLAGGEADGICVAKPSSSAWWNSSQAASSSASLTALRRLR